MFKKGPILIYEKLKKNLNAISKTQMGPLAGSVGETH